MGNSERVCPIRSVEKKLFLRKRILFFENCLERVLDFACGMRTGRIELPCTLQSRLNGLDIFYVPSADPSTVLVIFGVVSFQLGNEQVDRVEESYCESIQVEESRHIDDVFLPVWMYEPPLDGIGLKTEGWIYYVRVNRNAGAFRLHFSDVDIIGVPEDVVFVRKVQRQCGRSVDNYPNIPIELSVVVCQEIANPLRVIRGNVGRHLRLDIR